MKWWLQRPLELAAPSVELSIEAGSSPQEGSHQPLVEFLQNRPWPLTTFQRSVGALSLAGRSEAVRSVLVVATRAYPTSEWLKTETAKVEQQIAAAREAAAAAAAPVAAVVRLPGEKVFLQQLDTALDAARWDEAADLLRDAGAARPAPAWVTVREPSLRLAQARISRGQGDRAGMLTATRLFLNGDNERSQQVLELGRKYWDAGDKDAGRILVKEVLTRTPGFPPAVRLSAEWDPPPEVKKTDVKKSAPVKK